LIGIIRAEKTRFSFLTYIDIAALPIVDSTGAIFGISGDLGHFSVNAKTGEVNHFGRDVAGSHSYYTQIKPYNSNQYLVVENMQFYRDGNRCYPKCPMPSDTLYAWTGQKLLWSTDFPPHAELHFPVPITVKLSRCPSGQETFQ
jgi:hypothetical protein